MENLSIEIGNRNIKTNKGIVFPSRYTMFNQIGTEIIQYKGVNYFIGNGEYDIELEKSKKDFMPLLLTAIEKLLSYTFINSKTFSLETLKKVLPEHFVGSLKTYIFWLFSSKNSSTLESNILSVGSKTFSVK